MSLQADLAHVAGPRLTMRDNRRHQMRKILLTTVAVAAVVGYAGIAAAQNTDNQPKGSPGGQQEQKTAPSGAMAHPQGGTQPASKTMSPSSQSAQSPAQGAKQDERVGQGQDQNETKTPQRGPEQKGAQEDRTTPQKGAQDENSKSGVNATEQHATKSQGARGASVQLSQDQRSRIGA